MPHPIWSIPRPRSVPVAASVKRLAALSSLLLSIALLIRADQRWKLQFNYDKTDATFNIRDFACPSAQRCIAAGVVIEKNGRGKGTVAISSDGGQHWAEEEVKEQPLSLDFLNDSIWWMVTDKGVWWTNESGRTWKKLDGLPKKGIVRVHFLDASHGFAIGFPKVVLETKDAGKSWTKVEEAAKPNTNAEQTIYDCITFRGDHGVITGRLMPDEVEIDPALAGIRRERQNSSIILETQDGGKHWASTTSSIYGHITQVRLSDDQYAVTLVEYEDTYAIPSTLYLIRMGSNTAASAFAEKDRAVRDVVLLPDGRTILAAVEPPGRSNQVPVPGKLKMLVSSNRKVWLEMDVDYRAVAQRAILAAPDAAHVWVATDTGMILNLVDTSITKK